MNYGVDYLNVEYFLARSYEYMANLHFGWGDIPGWVGSLITFIMVFGMVASAILLVLVVYAQIRLMQVEHAGFHKLEEQDAHDEARAQPESAGTNDRWERIVTLANGTNAGDWRRAILEADIMLGDALAKAGYTGPTIGDQLKMANPIQVTTLDLAWKAHKVRNEVAHQGERYPLSERDVRATIDYYKRVFEELGEI